MNKARRYSTYVLAYILWFISITLAGLSLLQLRDAYLSLVVLNAYNQTKGNDAALFYANLQTRSLDVFSYLVLGLLLVIVIVFLEFFYRTGVIPGSLRLRFFLVSMLEFAVLLVATMINNIVAWDVSGFTWRSLFYPILELLITGIFIWLWIDSRRRIASLVESQPA